MGYKDIEGWTEHDQNFSNFLGSLNGVTEKAEDEIKVGSLEKKVQKCKSRINYHKFTKAKDLSRYSEKDLANIFGKKSFKENKIEIEAEVSQEMTTGNSEDIDGEMLVNKGSMADYFRKKLPNFGRAVNNVREIESESENERVGFGFQQANEDSSGVSEEKKNNKRKYFESFFPSFEKSSEEIVDEHKEKKKRKKDSVMGTFISYIYKDNEESNTNNQEIENCDVNIVEINGDFAKTKKKSKKLKIDKEGSKNEDSINGNEEIIDRVANEAQNEKKLKKLNSEDDLKKNSKSSLKEEISFDIKQDKKHKKSKKNSKEEGIEENVLNDANYSNKEIKSEEMIDAGIKCNKKDKKSKSKKENREIEEDAECIGLEALNNEDNVIEDESKRNIKKSKLKKKNKEIQDDGNCINSEILNNEDHHIIEDESKKHSKKSKSKKKNQEIQEDTDCNDTKTSNNEIIEDDSKNERKQKKSKKSKRHDEENGIENAGFSDYLRENEVICEETTEEPPYSKVKKEKKSKKKKQEENDNLGISNLAFDDPYNCSSVSNVSLQDEFEETPRKKKKKTKNRDGIDNPTFDIAANDVNVSQNQFELKTDTIEKGGLDNPALNLSDPILDCDLMLNVVDTPVILKKPIEKFALNSKITKLNNVKVRRKSVRFSDVLQEHIIPNDPTERINEYISNRNELFDINTMVIEESLKEEMQKQGVTYENGHRNNSSEESSYDLSNPKELNKKVVESSVKEELSRGLNAENHGFVNNGFDIRCVDKINFLDDRYEVKSSPSSEDGGIDNQAFNKLKNEIDENVESVSNRIETYQAEVENDINESKANNVIEDWLVGDVGSQIDRNVKVEDGLKLCFNQMHFRTPVPHYQITNVNRAKRSYRHLIRGDVTIAFKNSNLHEIKGYAVKTARKLRRH